MDKTGMCILICLFFTVLLVGSAFIADDWEPITQECVSPPGSMGPTICNITGGGFSQFAMWGAFIPFALSVMFIGLNIVERKGDN